MYLSTGAGYACLILTAQARKTQLLALPNLPYFHRANWQYTAFPKFSIEISNWSAVITHCVLTHTSRMSVSRRMFVKDLKGVMHCRLLQETFFFDKMTWYYMKWIIYWTISSSLSIGKHMRHWWQVRSFGGDGLWSKLSPTSHLAKSKLPLLMVNNLGNKSSLVQLPSSVMACGCIRERSTY